MKHWTFFCALLVSGLSSPWAVAQNPNVVLSVQDTTSGTGGATVPIDLTLDGLSAGGFALGVCHDPQQLNATSVDLGASLQAMNLGAGPGYLVINTDPGVGGDGFYVAMLFEFLSPPPFETLSPGTHAGIVTASYDVLAPADSTATLCFCDTLGLAPGAALVANEVVNVNGNSEVPTTECGTLEIVADAEFVRGDCNSSGTNNIADIVAILTILFPNGEPLLPSCADACDTNDDGSVNLADAVFFIDFLFSGIFPPPAPAAPFPSCGSDPTADSLDCVAFTACP